MHIYTADHEFNRLNLAADWMSKHCNFAKVGVSEYNWARVKLAVECLTEEEVACFLNGEDEFYEYCIHPRMSQEEFDRYNQQISSIRPSNYY